jgi:hypothetical protein
MLARAKMSNTQNMPDYRALENRFKEILNLRRRPVAVGFPSEAPRALNSVAGPARASR